MRAARTAGEDAGITIRSTSPADFDAIAELTAKVYPGARPWPTEQLQSHLRVFPEGQFVAVDRADGHLVGMSACLIVRWDDYDMTGSWRDFTDEGWFTNHDPSGRTLYGAETMVDPDFRGRGVGSRIYEARRVLARRVGLERIRFGALLRGYHEYADRLSPEQYLKRVLAGEIRDPTIGFQLRHGFHPIAVVPNYLRQGADPRSRGHAVVMEWLTSSADDGD